VDEQPFCNTTLSSTDRPTFRRNFSLHKFGSSIARKICNNNPNDFPRGTRAVKISFQELKSRITGVEISTIYGGIGISWNPTKSEMETARGLITFLEDRRALYNPYEAETARYAIRSIQTVRDRLTQDLGQLDHSSQLAQWIRGIRAACRNFQNKVEHLNTDDMPPIYARRHIWETNDQEFFMALGELRAMVGYFAVRIAVRYEIDVEEELASIFPAATEEE
jgi:hypothetical protein